MTIVLAKYSHLSVSVRSNSLFFLLLLLSGDVETNPGSRNDEAKYVYLVTSDQSFGHFTGSQYRLCSQKNHRQNSLLSANVFTCAVSRAR